MCIGIACRLHVIRRASPPIATFQEKHKTPKALALPIFGPADVVAKRGLDTSNNQPQCERCKKLGDSMQIEISHQL